MEKEMSDLENIAERATHDLTADLTDLRNDISKLSASVLELVQNQAGAAKQQVLGAADEARQKFSAQTAEAKDRLSAITTDLENSIERSPFTAVLAGAIAGFLIGILIRPHK
jgi:ElaB/YqjD/DUF883 family membrane-anchored ribosome-binding protein